MFRLVLTFAMTGLFLSGCSRNESHGQPASLTQKSVPARAVHDTIRSTPGENGQRATGAGLSFLASSAWKSTTPNSRMRVSQWVLPGAPGANEDGELALYFFGENQGGSVEANIGRWIGQMQQPNGAKSEDVAQSADQRVGDLKVTTVRLNGIYAGSMMPGMGEGQPKPNSRLWGAVIEGKGGPWFFKAIGPQDVIRAAEPALDVLARSVQIAR